MAAPPLGGRRMDVAMVLSLGSQHWSDHLRNCRPQQRMDRLHVFALAHPRFVCDMGGLTRSYSETDSQRTQPLTADFHNRPTADTNLAPDMLLVFETATCF